LPSLTEEQFDLLVKQGGVLSRNEIYDAINQGKIVVDYVDEQSFQPNGIDLHLGNFYWQQIRYRGVIKVDKPPRRIERVYHLHDAAQGDGYLNFEPMGFYLAHSIEFAGSV